MVIQYELRFSFICLVIYLASKLLQYIFQYIQYIMCTLKIFYLEIISYL